MDTSRSSIVASVASVTAPSARTATADRPVSRDNNFDTLRLVFAVCVLLAHSYVLPTNGAGTACFILAGGRHCLEIGYLARVGLVGFFALSGYLVCASYLSSRSVWSYLWKRLLRIEPLFLTVAVLCTLVIGPIGSDDPRSYFRDLHVGTQLRAIATLHLSTTTAHVFPRNSNHELNGPTWSLPLEFALYLLVALLGRAAWLRLRWPAALCWVALVILHVVTFRFEPHWAKIPRFAQGTMQGAIPLYVAFVGGMVVRLYPALRDPRVVAVILLLWVVAYLRGAGSWCGYMLAPFFIIWMGESRIRLPRPRYDLSYGIYLIAWPVQQLLLAFFSLQAFSLLVWTLAISCPLAILSWRFVEQPALRLKKIDFPWGVFSTPSKV